MKPMKPMETSRNKRLWRHLLIFIKKLFDAELTYYASSLSFYTIFTIIPLLLIVLTLITNTPSFIEHYESIKAFIIENLMPVHSESVTNYIDGFLQNSVKLGVFGTVMVFVASMLFFDNYEYIVSKIFHVKQRTIWESITTYWTLLTLTPIALVAFFYLSAQASDFLNTHEVSTGFQISSAISSADSANSGLKSLLSRQYFTIDLAAIRPSACEPEENLWPDAPTPSPAVNRPLTVVIPR